MTQTKRVDVAVVGGGLYGCYLATYLAGAGKTVSLCEAEGDLMTRASYNNQARVHAGYHYPRSFTTARRARTLLPQFLNEFSAAVSHEHRSIYAVSRARSKVTADMFERMMAAAGAPLRPFADAQRTFARNAVEAAYEVTEPVFDAAKLREIVRARLGERGVDVRTGSRVEGVTRANDGRLRLRVAGTPDFELDAREAYVCTYSAINPLLRASDLPTLPFAHQLTEICLVKVPDALARFGITVVDGPFFSLMPFPDRGCHSLTHVTYTNTRVWDDREGATPKPGRSAFAYMVKDAAAFVPDLKHVEYVDSLWEIKTLLPRTRANDGRPILLVKDHGLPGLHVVMGGKIDNVLDLIDSVAAAQPLGDAV